MAAGSAAVLTSFLTNLYICLGCFTAFTLLRVRPWARRFFAARRYAKDIDLKPKRLPNGPFGWIFPVLTYEEEDIIDECGLDCAMYLRILRFGVYLFFVLTIWCIIVILPPNMTSNEIDRLLALEASNSNTTVGSNTTSSSSSTSEYKFTNFDHYSLSNLPARSSKMWAHLISVYFVVLYVHWLLWRFNKESVLLRLMFLGNAKRGGPSHTVLVTDIPGVTQVVARSLRGEKRKNGESSPGLSKSPSFTNIMFQADTTCSKANQEDKSSSAAAAAAAPCPAPSGAAAPVVAVVASTSNVGTPAKAPGAAAPASVTSTSGKSPGATEPVSVKDTLPVSEPPTPLRSLPVGTAGPNGTTAPYATPQNAAEGSRAAKSGSSSSNGTSSTVSVDLASPPAGAGAGAGADAQQGCGGCLPLVSKVASEIRSARSSSGGSAAPSGFASYQCVVADPDPRFVATGGRLELPRVGKGNAEILAELQTVEPEDLARTLPPNLGVDTRPLPPSRRLGKRFSYDLSCRVLDPHADATRRLKSGLTPQQFVAGEFSLVFSPHNVAAVNMIQDTAGLEPLAEEFNKVAEQLEDYLDMARLRLKLRKELPQKQLTILCALYGDWEYVKKHNTKWFVKVDAVEFWLERLRFLRERIKVEQEIAMRKIAPSAFVTFNTRMSQAVAANSLLSHDETYWRVQNAPAPFEVVWKNLALTLPVKSGRLYILWAAFWAMAIFFMIPVTAIQALIEVPKLAKVPVLGAIVTAPAVRQILEAIVPGLALKIFLALVPLLLRIMALLSGATSQSEIDFGVTKRFFLFQVIVVFFGNIIAGSFFNQLKQWANDPASVVPTLGKSIPMTSTFFITYLLINGLSVKAIAFFRPPAFILFWVLSRFAGSPRARQRIWMYQYTDNGTTVVDHTIAMMIGMTFSCINPIVCPAALCYFLVNYVGERYNNIYVFRRTYESGGMLWKTVYNQVMVGLYIMQLAMLGLLSIKKFPFAPLIIPLLICSIASHISTLKLYRRPWSVAALHDAAEMDLLEADQRRMQLLAAAKEERKKKRDKRKREEEVREAEAESLLPPQPADAPEAEKPGKAERLLMESLKGDGFAMTAKEKREIAEMYLNPAFKVKLEDVERLARLAAEVQSRLPRLNEWVAQYKAYQREVKRQKHRGKTALPPPPKMPEDLTIYDMDLALMDSDEDEAVVGTNGAYPGSGKGSAGKQPSVEMRDGAAEV
ncbi:hypothetical protein Agub_g11860 [Astrephomene gubernaculifera]|uniref:ERD4-related membrane protein n=1 Tax=Astrephomene gubernaculifera TaxID=47775 RepID=A0AAD3DZI2_9CHLO|nr:hypothetical protein Agub_g11860 [Astrephomene gubernaculifera]